MENKLNSFNDYGYSESQSFKPKNYEVSISPNDSVISVTEDGSLLATVKLGIDGQTLSLIGKDGTEFSTVDLPSASVIESAEYDEERQVLILTVKLSDGSSKTIEVSFVDMLDDYAKKADVEKNAQAIADEAAARSEADAKFAEKDAEIDAALSKKVELTEFEYEGASRKAIVLGNHDTLLGETTSGGTVNIAMVSKWDKVDLGSVTLPINLNGSEARPTYNDTMELALVDDLSDMATKSWVSEQNFLTEHQDISGLATKEEISDMLTKTEAASTYQPIGEYLTSVPEEYVTDVELDEKTKNAVQWSEFELNGEKRKSILLANYDPILGTATNGQTYNIGMISKWDKVDLGTASLPINLNTPKGVRPTVQEAGQSGEEAHKMAYLSDIQFGVYSLGEVGSFNNLDEKASEQGVCDNQDNVILTFKITSTSRKESGFIVNIRYGNKISQALYWKQSLKPEMFRTLTISDDGSIDNPAFYPYDDTVSMYKRTVPGLKLFALTTMSSSDDIKAALTDSIGEQTPITQKEFDDCLKYGYYILDSSMRTPVFVGWDGQAYTLTSFGLPNPRGEVALSTISIQISGDVYSVKKSGSRATIITSNNITTNSSVVSLSAVDDILSYKISLLEEKLNSLTKTNIESVTLNQESLDNFNDGTKDYIISGEETKSTTIIGKTVKLDKLAISNNARTTIKASDIELKGVTLSGEFPKTDGNAVVKLDDADFIVVRDMVFDSSNVYNGIEIGLSSTKLPKSILFENCKFLGSFSNNAILIFGTEDNAVININNCYFENLSNPFRLSNNKNVKCVMNIVNCRIDKWDVNSPWQGMLLMQDYTSGDAEKANTNNLFAPEKITINVVNTIGPNGKRITMPSDISTICGTGDDKQIFYVWDNYRNVVTYDKSKYPTITIA